MAEIVGLLLTLLLLIGVLRFMTRGLTTSTDAGAQHRPRAGGVPASTVLVLVGIVSLFELDVLPLASTTSLTLAVVVLAVVLAGLAGRSPWWDAVIGWVGALLAGVNVYLVAGPGVLAGYLIILVMIVWVHGVVRRVTAR